MLEKYLNNYISNPQEVLLSIIIPIYNVEPYIDQCLSSVLACDLSDSEVILSLGKSADNSAELAMRYQRKSPNVKVIYQKGKGLSDARNTAMRIAKGKFIAFIDSDDYILPDAFNQYIEDLRNGTLDADLIISDFYRIERKDGYKLAFFQIGEETPVQKKMEFLPNMLKKRECFWNVWRFIFRRDFLEKNKLLFLENRLSEDVDFITRVIAAEPSVFFIHRPYYIYAVGRDGSLMGDKNFKFLDDSVYVLKDSIGRMRKMGSSYADAVIAQYQYEYLLDLAIPSELPVDEREKAFSLFKDYEVVLSHSEDIVITMTLTFIKMFGLHSTSFLLHSLKKIRRLYRIISKRTRSI